MIDNVKGKVKIFLSSLRSDRKKQLLVLGGGIVVIAIFIVLVIVFSDNVFLAGSLYDPDEEKFKSEYEELNTMVTDDNQKYPVVNIPADNNIKYNTYDDVLKIFDNNGDAVVYLGTPTCAYCRNAIQVLLDTAKSMDLNVINYLEVDERNDGYDKLMKKLGDNFIVEENNQKSIYSPLVLFITNGSVVSYNKGTLFSQTDPFVKMDDSQIQGLSEIYKYGINDVLTSIKIKSGATNNSNS